jgi:Protein of unknown function (DUF1292)
MEQPEFADAQLVTLTDADGQPQPARIFSVFPFEGQEYALLAKVDDPEAASAGPLTLMRIVERGEEAVFQSIESDEEFERVMAFIRGVARQMDEEKQ